MNYASFVMNILFCLHFIC